MNHGKRRFRFFGVFLLTAVAFMGIGAVSAQATGNWSLGVTPETLVPLGMGEE